MESQSLPPAGAAQQLPPEQQQQVQQASPQSIRAQYVDWPQKGDQRAQPWDLVAAGIPQHEQGLAEGAPDTISPIVIRHSYPILASGSAGSVVNELATRLHVLGYATDISRGENAYGVLTNDVMGSVEKFREDYGVREDPTPFGGDTQSGRAKANGIVGPYTWEALVRASDRVLNG